MLTKTITAFFCLFLLAALTPYGSERVSADHFLAYTTEIFDYNQDVVAVRLKYPEVTGPNRQYRSVNEQIRKSMMTIRFPGKATNQVFGKTKDLVQGVRRFIMRNDFKGYEFSSVADVMHNAKGIFTVKILNYEMPYGAANGSNSIVYLNFDIETGKRLGISGCFSDDRRKELVNLGKEFFIKKVKADNMFDLLDGQFLESFYLPENFAVTERGVEFVYQQYEIGPRSLGMPAFTIPHGEMRDLMDKECVLRQHLYR